MRPPLAAIRASRRSAAAFASAAASATDDDLALIARPPWSGQLAPAAAVAGEQLVGLFRALAAGLVDRSSPLAPAFFQASRNGCTARQPASTLSARWNRMSSPIMQS